MTKRIEEDYKDFRDYYSGKTQKRLSKWINNGHAYRLRSKDGKWIPVTIEKIDIPHIVRGKPQEGIGRGEGDIGDIIDRDAEAGKGKRAGQGEADGVTILVDLDDVLKFMQDELCLPDLKPKPNQTYEDVKIKYNDISLSGPESLRHNRRTLLQALKRQCIDGSINDLQWIPGFAQPIKKIVPINADRRYRQYKEIRIPADNAVVFFARDGSGSMSDYKCEIVSDMSWWIDAWIRRFYKRVERCYIWHDTKAKEVDEDTFYNYRYGGGTTCSSALKLIAKQFENRFPPEKWNIYILYFSDGDNWDDDNEEFCEVIKKEFPPNIVNFMGITQIMPYGFRSLKQYVDKHLHLEHLRTTSIGPEEENLLSSRSYSARLTEEERDDQVKNAIIDLLGSSAKVEA